MESTITPHIARRLSQSDRLPSPPAVALRLIELSRQDELEFAALADTIATDPALTTKIERVVHSPLYGLRAQVSSLRQALTLLGMRETMSMALSFALVGALRSIASGTLDYEYFWQRSLLGATSARTLGKQLRRLDYEDLFLSALLQDIGMIALDQAIPETYSGVGEEHDSHESLRMEEHLQLGCDHAEIGAWLLEIWNLPAKLQRAVRWSDTPDKIDLDDVETVPERIVALSGPLADVWLGGDWEGAYARAVDLGGSLLGLSRAQVDEVVGAVGDQVAEVEGLFDITLVPPESLARIASEAKEIGIVWPSARETESIS